MLPDVPAPFTTTPDHAADIAKMIEEFFDSILEYLEYDSKARKSFVEMVPNSLARHGEAGASAPTDDQVTFLVVRGVTLASVIERRNDGNAIDVRFGAYLTPDIIARVSLSEHG